MVRLCMACSDCLERASSKDHLQTLMLSFCAELLLTATLSVALSYSVSMIEVLGIGVGNRIRTVVYTAATPTLLTSKC